VNKKIIVSALISAFLVTSASAFAQDHNHQHDRGWQQQEQHGHGNMRSNYHANHASNRGAGPHHNLRKGARLPAEYRNKQYVVNDWRGHRLNAPPRGYHWVQTGGDYVLAAVATGLIAQVFLNN
jgi:Ni/Co efflux regulator RcnB